MTTGHDVAATVVAVEVVLLRPRGATAAEDAGRWPVFAMVVTEPPGGAAAHPLFALLDRPRRDGEPTVVAAETAWAVLDEENALLRLTVRGTAPVRFELRVLLPSAQAPGVLDVVARGVTIGITTRRRSAGLRDRVDVRTALRDLVLLSCPPSAELAALVASR